MMGDCETSGRAALRRRFEETFHGQPERWFSAPGRTEPGGNRTAHQHGHVLHIRPVGGVELPVEEIK